MAHLTVTRKSGSLGTETNIHIIAPNAGTEKPLKVLYLLHGLSDDSSCWSRYTSLELFVRDQNLLVVMPDGGRSFYHDLTVGGHYFTYLTKELPEWIQFLFSVSKKREDTMIAGFSMGGYGALKTGLTYPEKYGSIAAFSSVSDVRRHYADGSLPVRQVFGEEPDWAALDLFELASKADASSVKPKIYQWCGTSDFLYQDNKKLQRHMESLSFDYHFFEGNGDHQWKYWNEQIERALVFFDLIKKQ